MLPEAPRRRAARATLFLSAWAYIFMKDGRYIPLAVEPADWRPSVWGGVTTVGTVTKTTLKAIMQTPASPTQLSGNLEFLLVCPAGVTESEYHLLRAEENKKGREFKAEFQVLDDGSHVALGGKGRNKIRFPAEEVAAGRFKLKLPEPGKGEFAFLPPTKDLSGKVYTFGVQ